jgi:hypothetical protein
VGDLYWSVDLFANSLPPTDRKRNDFGVSVGVGLPSDDCV